EGGRRPVRGRPDRAGRQCSGLRRRRHRLVRPGTADRAGRPARVRHPRRVGRGGAGAGCAPAPCHAHPMSVRGMGELGLLDRIKPYLAAGAGGDDAAVIADATGFVVASTDMFVEGVHFDLGWMSAEDAGWRSLALALGDLAAKGAEPLWALAAVAIPKQWPVE